MLSMKEYWREGGVVAVKYALVEAVVQWVLLKLLAAFAPKEWSKKTRLDVSNRCIASLHAMSTFIPYLISIFVIDALEFALLAQPLSFCLPWEERFASSGRDLTLLSSKSSIVAVTAFSGDVLVCRCLNRIAMFGRTVYYWWNINPTFTIPLEMSDYQNLTNDLMVGYLFYDTISEIFVMGNLDLLMLGHHVVGLASHVTCRINSLGACAYYHMMVYIAEASTPFLHLSYILKSNDMKDSALFKVCVLLLLILFLLVRLLWGPFMQYDLHMRQEHWFLTVAGKALYWPNVACVLFFNLVNFTWGQKLFLIAYKSVTGGGEEDETPPKKAKGSRGKAKDKGKKRD